MSRIVGQLEYLMTRLQTRRLSAIENNVLVLILIQSRQCICNYFDHQQIDAQLDLDQFKYEFSFT